MGRPKKIKDLYHCGDYPIPAGYRMGNMEECAKDKKIKLWGHNKIDSRLFNFYYKVKPKPEIKKKEPKIEVEKPKEYDPKEMYITDDLPFLNNEYKRLDELMSTKEFFQRPDEEQEKYMDIQEKLSDLIDSLNQQLEFRKKIGQGFKKGTPEAKAWGQKMAELRRQKKQPNQQPKIKEKKFRPYCNVGDVPKGYKSGTQEECIKMGQIGMFGLNKVDSDIYEKELKSNPKLIEKQIRTNQGSQAFFIGKLNRINKDIKTYSTKPSGREMPKEYPELLKKVQAEKKIVEDQKRAISLNIQRLQKLLNK
jgi:hypothetical protein